MPRTCGYVSVHIGDDPRTHTCISMLIQPIFWRTPPPIQHAWFDTPDWILLCRKRVLHCSVAALSQRRRRGNARRGLACHTT